MPSIHYLNPPPNPFWDFVAGLEDHPFFAGHGRPPTYTSRDNAGDPNVSSETANPAAQPSETVKGKQPSVEDPPEVDPATLNNDSNEKALPEGLREGGFRGRGRFGNAFESQFGSRGGHGCRGRGAHEGGGGHHDHSPLEYGPLPFMFGGPWTGRGSPPAGSDRSHQPPFGGRWHHGPGPHHHHHHRGGRHGAREGRPGSDGFNLGEFLNKLGDRLGVDLSGAAEGVGLDLFAGPRANPDRDFEPRGDIFDTPESYVIHLSLPGAKKEDVGVDWDGENSILRITGVVHRPGADEQLLSQLVVDQRKREVGVFEKSIRLGTKRDPASIDVAGISAKMTDGVLIVKVPKVEVEHKKREIPITGSATSSPAPHETEKETLLDTDNEMYDVASAPAPAAAPLIHEPTEKEQIAANEYHDGRSETMDYERNEKAPEYQVEDANEESDWEKAGTEDEGEYVKINVD